MLMPNQLYNNNLNFYTNSNLNMNMHHHINELLNTAAAGQRDVDALLAPIKKQSRNDFRPERNLWRTEEIIQMLTIMQNINAIEMLNDKNLKSESIFRTVEKHMHENGFRKKTHVQIWTKWKFLKSTYTTSRRNNTMSKMIPLEIYELLHKMLGNGATDAILSNGVDSDTTNGARLMPVGKEGVYNDNNNKSRKKSNANMSDDENGFGMAHPIFGFRLGLIKPEPLDNGYETNTNDTNTEAHTNNANYNAIKPFPKPKLDFSVKIKKEIDEPQSPPPLVLSKAPMEIFINKHLQITPIPTVPAATNAQHAATTNEAKNNTTLPPLRIATFAKTAHANSLRSPPPLTINPTARQSLNNNNNNNKTARCTLPTKLLTKPTYNNQTTTQAIKADEFESNSLKDISATTQMQYNDIPDFGATPPTMPMQPYMPMYQDVPTTSQQAVMIVAKTNKNRKRRLEVPPVPSACKKLTPTQLNSKSQEHNPQNEPANIVFNAATTQKKRFKEALNAKKLKQKKAQQQNETFQKSKEANTKDTFQNDIIELSNSLLQVQRDMMAQFFKQQMDLAYKEHEFQMKQDQKIMKAFQTQSKKIMESARKLLDIDLRALFGGTLSENKNVEPTTAQAHKIVEHKATATDPETALEAEIEPEPETETDAESTPAPAQQSTVETDLQKSEDLHLIRFNTIAMKNATANEIVETVADTVEHTATAAYDDPIDYEYIDYNESHSSNEMPDEEPNIAEEVHNNLNENSSYTNDSDDSESDYDNNESAGSTNEGYESDENTDEEYNENNMTEPM